MPKAHVYTVSQFVGVVDEYLREGLGTVVVRGEVVDFKVVRERLVFFELKDAEARVGCFMMRWELKTELEDGMEIEVTGTPGLFKQSGRFHIRVIDVQLVGAGALAAAFQKLKLKLEKEGLFAPERKRALPRFPEVIGIVSSSEGAAITDIRRVLANRWAGLRLVLAPVAVQGIGAVSQIVGAIGALNARLDVEVIIVARGGGSLEDLQAFNTEDVARAVFGSRVPVVSGVGHERDVTICDLVADLRAATPSNAAELVVPDKREVAAGMTEMLERVAGILSQRMSELRADIRHAVFSMERQLAAPQTRLTVAARQLGTSVGTWLSSRETKVGHLEKMLSAYSPRATLDRGYSITTTNGKLLKDPSATRDGTELETILAKGKLRSIVRRNLGLGI